VVPLPDILSSIISYYCITVNTFLIEDHRDLYNQEPSSIGSVYRISSVVECHCPRRMGFLNYPRDHEPVDRDKQLVNYPELLIRTS